MPMTTTTMEMGGGSSTVFMSSRARSLLSLRRNQVVSMEPGHEQELHELDLFQTHVADRLHSLLPTSSSPITDGNKGGDQQQPILSLLFLQKLLDALVSCEDEFEALLAGSPASAFLSKPPLDRAVSDLLDRDIKSLDICNAVSLVLHSIHHWHRQADIAASTLNSHLPLGPAQLKRAQKALNKLLLPSPPSDPRPNRQESNGGGGGGGGGGGSKAERSRSSGLPRTLSWGLARTWSAAKQVQAMWANLATPRIGDAGGSCGAGLAVAVYTMSSLLVFAMWALVAALPCGDRGGPAVASPVPPPRQLAWAAAMVGLQERITEEWRRREKKGAPPSVGLLAELQGVERCGRRLMEALGSTVTAEEAAAKAAELAVACQNLDEGLGPFERQVREVYHRVVGSRAEVLRCLDQNTRSSSLSMLL